MEIIVFFPDINTFKLIPVEDSKVNCRKLSATEIFRLFVRNENISGINPLNIKVDDKIKELTFERYAWEFLLELEPQQEFVAIRPLVIKRQDQKPLHFEEIAGILETGYLISGNVWIPIEETSLTFIKGFVKKNHITKEERIPLVSALKYSFDEKTSKYIKFIFPLPELKSVFEKTFFPVHYKESNRYFLKNLYDYQEKGLAWLKFCCLKGIGTILADDMGLGKTAQIIALICWIIETKLFKHILILVPSTLLENWHREFSEFSPELKHYIHHGDKRTGFYKELYKENIVLTSYSLCVNDYFLLNKIDWDLVIVDEAGAIKSPEAERSKAVNALPSKVRIAMTGTPVENSLSDLWSITNFVNPGYLGDYDAFSKKFIRNNTSYFPDSQFEELERHISQIIIRRMKKDVLTDLPDQIDIHHALRMSSNEQIFYEMLTNDIRNSVQNSKNNFLSLLKKLHRYCTHPVLLEKSRSYEYSTDALSSLSVKFERTIELLNNIRAKSEKVLIFTTYLQMIDIFKYSLSAHYGIEVFNLDGRVQISDRQIIIDKFSSEKGFSILVVNPATGGVGLNITAANHVIHYTRQWNPALEIQASARIYRKGQKKVVDIFYLYYVNSIDELIDERLRLKTRLSESIIKVNDEKDSVIEEFLKILKNEN